MSNEIKVAVLGARGRMGQEVVKMVLASENLRLVAAIDRTMKGLDVGAVLFHQPCGVLIDTDLQEALKRSEADVLVDFTDPHSVFQNACIAIENGTRPIIGATGLSNEQISELDERCKAKGIGGLFAPNFSIGAILMMKFAAEAAKYFPNVEIIEYHGDQKLDAPSGTSIQTAQRISKQRQALRQGNPNEQEIIPGSRGGEFDGFRIHSVRLPGIFAQQEVIFAGNGQALKIRHDSYDRAGYMPGVKLAVEKVVTYQGMIYGFEHLLTD